MNSVYTLILQYKRITVFLDYTLELYNLVKYGNTVVYFSLTIVFFFFFFNPIWHVKNMRIFTNMTLKSSAVHVVVVSLIERDVLLF